jgi:hypothetical protein
MVMAWLNAIAGQAKARHVSAKTRLTRHAAVLETELLYKGRNLRRTIVDLRARLLRKTSGNRPLRLQGILGEF